MGKSKRETSDDWYEFINKAFYEFRGNSRKTISEFADFFGFTQGQMSYYMKKDGRIPREPAVIEKFVSKLGPQVYSVLGYPDPSKSDDKLSSLPEPLRSALAKSIEKANELDAAGDPERSFEIVREIFQEYGIKLILTDDSSESNK